MRRKAFTLMELSVSLAIIITMASFSMITLNSLGSKRLDNAAYTLASDLEWARACTLARHENYTVNFNTGSDTYWITNDTGTIRTQKLSGVDLQTVVDFSGNARTYAGFHVPFGDGDDRSITLAAGGKTRLIQVFDVTGNVEIQ